MFTQKQLEDFNAIKYQIEAIGTEIGKAIFPSLSCDTFEITNTGIDFSLEDNRGEPWDTVSVTFDQMAQSDVAALAVAAYKAQQESKRQQEKAESLARQESKERAMLEHLQQKYSQR